MFKFVRQTHKNSQQLQVLPLCLVTLCIFLDIFCHLQDFFFFFLSELKSPSSDPRNRLGRTSAMTSNKCLSSELITVLDALFDFDAHLAAVCGF